jgi:hypothetical protein
MASVFLLTVARASRFSQVSTQGSGPFLCCIRISLLGFKPRLCSCNWHCVYIQYMYINFEHVKRIIISTSILMQIL